MANSEANPNSALSRPGPPEPSREALLAQLADLAREFGAESIANTARTIAERSSEQRFYVACIGQFKRGKSTLLNALIGHPVLPTAVVPVTAVPTILRYGRSLSARVRLQNSEWMDIAVPTVEEYVSEGKNPQNAKKVAGVEIFVPSALLETGMCLVDTPGISSVFAGNTAATEAFIPHMDAAIVVIGADPPLSGDELQLVEALSPEVQELLFVLNKADRNDEVERAAAVEFSRRALESGLERPVSEIFEVSALERMEQRGRERDWNRLVGALENLGSGSGRSLVRQATDRGIRRTTSQLLAVLDEERDALKRPVEESERRIERLEKILTESDLRMPDLAVLLTAAQQQLAAVLGERRKAFLELAQPRAAAELAERLPSLTESRNGPAYRRSVNQLAQQIARGQLAPWLEREAAFAEQEFRNTAKRFVELANQFLHRLGDIGIPGLEELPNELDSAPGLAVRSQFYFHGIERVAAPASPFLFLEDLLLGGLGLRGAIVRDAREFLEELLEINSARVQSDVDERVRESRKSLETVLKGILREASDAAARALARARAAQSGGAPAIERAVARLASAREFVQSVRSRG
jgi:putative ribosome biogenesis GTPase RsgA